MISVDSASAATSPLFAASLKVQASEASGPAFQDSISETSLNGFTGAHLRRWGTGEWEVLLTQPNASSGLGGGTHVRPIGPNAKNTKCTVDSRDVQAQMSWPYASGSKAEQHLHKRVICVDRNHNRVDTAFAMTYSNSQAEAGQLWSASFYLPGANKYMAPYQFSSNYPMPTPAAEQTNPTTTALPLRSFKIHFVLPGGADSRDESFQVTSNTVDNFCTIAGVEVLTQYTRQAYVDCWNWGATAADGWSALADFTVSYSKASSITGQLGAASDAHFSVPEIAANGTTDRVEKGLNRMYSSSVDNGMQVYRGGTPGHYEVYIKHQHQGIGGTNTGVPIVTAADRFRTCNASGVSSYGNPADWEGGGKTISVDCTDEQGVMKDTAFSLQFMTRQ